MTLNPVLYYAMIRLTASDQTRCDIACRVNHTIIGKDVISWHILLMYQN